MSSSVLPSFARRSVPIHPSAASAKMICHDLPSGLRIPGPGGVRCVVRAQAPAEKYDLGRCGVGLSRYRRGHHRVLDGAARGARLRRRLLAEPGLHRASGSVFHISLLALPAPERAGRLGLVPSVVAALPPSRTVALRKHASPSSAAIVAALQTGPVRRGLLVRRFPLRGAVNNFRSEYA